MSSFYSAITQAACVGLLITSFLGSFAMADQQVITPQAASSTGSGDSLRVDCKLALQTKSSTPTLALAIIGAADKQRAVAIPYSGKGTGNSSAQVELLAGQALEFLGVVDLAGTAATITLAQSACVNHEVSVQLSDMRQPALLIKVLNQTASTQESLILLSAEQQPRVIWTQAIRSQAANGAGFQTVDMRLEAGSGNVLDIVLLQHELPDRNDRDYMPGPPLLLRFRLIDGRYEQQF